MYVCMYVCICLYVCSLPLALKIEALGTMGLSKIEHHFSNTFITEEQLQDFDKVLISCLRKIFNLNNNTTTRTMFIKKQHGGLGIRKPSTIYKATRINLLIKMLNYPDNNFKFIARHSLALDFMKRGIPRSQADNNFLGYSVKENGMSETHIKGGFGVQSDWPQLFHLVQKINANLNWEKNTEDLYSAGNAQLIMKSEHNGTRVVQNDRIRKEIIEDQLSKDLEDLKKLPMQGRLVDNKSANNLMSQNIFRNCKLTDQLIYFWYKARQNVLPCYYTLSLWYPNQPTTCALDGYHIESTAHVLNGCQKLKNNYSKRHDRVVDKIGNDVKSSKNTVFINKTVRTALQELGMEFEDNDEELLNLKPDIMIKEENRMIILDIACPYDLYLAELYEMKLNKYRDLQRYITEKFISCKVDAVIIGSLGTVHTNALKVLMDTGMSKTKAKGLLKWSSTSCIIGSRQIWNIRCKLVKEN